MAQIAGGRALRGAAVGVCLALVAAGCGTRWDDDQRAEMTDRYERARSDASNDDAADDDATADPVSAGSDAGTTGTGDGSTTGGTTGTGGGTTGGVASPANLPCRAASQAPGVTNDAITLGTVTSLSGPVPGLGESSLAGVRAYAAYVNSTGGVCGRQVKVKAADDGGDNAQDRAVTSDLIPQVLGLVAGVAGGLAGSEDVIAQTKVPAIETATSPVFVSRVPNVFGTNPAFPDLKAVTAKFKYLYDQGARKAAVVYVNAQTAPEEVHLRQSPLMEAAGIQVVLELPLPLTTLSYDSAARAVANSGADYLLFLHEVGASSSMARSMADSGHKLKFAEYITGYGSSLAELAGSAAEGATTWIRSLPNEDRGKNAELDAYLQWMAKAAPGSATDGFAADAWAASKLFLDSLKALNGPITREALVAQLAATDNYDAGGFYGPIRVGPKLTKGCMIAMIVRGGKWERLTPSQGFLC